MAHDLYDRDFYDWTRTQAEALRARQDGANAIDYDRVAEEIEDSGKRGLRVVERLLVRIIQHLHYLRSSKAREPVGRWKREIRAFRTQAARRLTPSMRAAVQARLDGLHDEGADEAERWADVEEPFFDPIDRTRRWSLEELLGETDDPLATIRSAVSASRTGGRTSSESLRRARTSSPCGSVRRRPCR